MANTKVTGDLIAGLTIATGNIADDAVTSDKISGITTAHITEGSNLYYTDARADARVNLQTGANLSLSNKSTSDLSEGTNLYYTDARADARAALLVDSAPSTLDTLNELAAALGDDPNFATTTANSIGLKAPLASPTFTGTVGISATIPRLNFTDLQQDDWAIINDNGEFKFQCTSGSGVALLLNTSNNATFAGEISSGDDINVNNGKLVVNHTSAEVRIKSSSDTGESYINFSDPSDINPGQIYYGHSNNTMVFRVNDIGQMSLSNNLLVFPSTGVHEIRGDRGSGAFAIGNMGDASSQMMVSSRGFLTFNVSNTGSALNATERMRIDSSGDISFGGNSHTPYIQLVNSGRTAGNPGFSFYGDTNTGMFQPAGVADTVAFSTGGAERMRIDSSGIVKINTTDTNAGFRVNEARTSEWIAGFKHTGATPYGVFIDTIASTGVYTFACYTNAGTGLFLKNDGNLGIGTTDPDHKLEVVGGLALRNSNSRLYFGTNNGTDRRALEGNVGGTLLQIGEGYTTSRIYGVAQVMGATLAVGDGTAFNTYQGISAYGSNPSLALRASSTSSWCWTEYRTNGNTNNFSMGVNQSVPYWGVKNGAGLDNPVLKVKNVGGVTQTDKHENGLYSDANQPPAVYLGKSGNVMGTGGIYRLGSVVSSSTTTATNIPVVTTYSSGHWGAQPTFTLEFVVTFYRASYAKYWCQHAVSQAFASVMHGPFGGQMISSPLTTTVTQLCSNCNSGQPVYKTVWKWTNSGAYIRTTPTISIQYGAGSTRVYTDGTSTESLIDTLHGGSGSPGAGILLHGIDDAQAAGGDIITYN